MNLVTTQHVPNFANTGPALRLAPRRTGHRGSSQPRVSTVSMYCCQGFPLHLGPVQPAQGPYQENGIGDFSQHPGGEHHKGRSSQ